MHAPFRLPIPSEDALQKALATHWQQRGVSGSILAHIPNGGARNKIVGAQLKGMGVLPGMLDNFGLGDVPFFLELKHPKYKNPLSRLSPEQKDVIAKLRERGVPVYVSSDLDEAIDILEQHQVLRGGR
jgi:hypothetical protein